MDDIVKESILEMLRHKHPQYDWAAQPAGAGWRYEGHHRETGDKVAIIRDEYLCEEERESGGWLEVEADSEESAFTRLKLSEDDGDIE